jgi:hypothetical protein
MIIVSHLKFGNYTGMGKEILEDLLYTGIALEKQ